jgi:hypothetical protein
MATVKLHTAHQEGRKEEGKHLTFWDKAIAFADSQAKQKTKWFLISFVIQGVFFIPVPVLVIYYYHAPVFCVIVTLTLFFTTVILGMIGASARKIILCFALSIVLNLLMLAAFMILG